MRWIGRPRCQFVDETCRTAGGTGTGVDRAAAFDVFTVRTAFGIADGLTMCDLGHFVVRGLDHTVCRVGQQILWPLSTQETVNRGKPVGQAPRVLRIPE